MDRCMFTSKVNLRISLDAHARDLRNECLQNGSSDAARVRARAREMKGPRWPRCWRKRGRIEIARRLTKIENSKRSIISRARVASDCADASTPNHVLRHAARPHARCGFSTSLARSEMAARSTASTVRSDQTLGLRVRKPSCTLIVVDFYVGEGGGYHTMKERGWGCTWERRYSPRQVKHLRGCSGKTK